MPPIFQFASRASAILRACSLAIGLAAGCAWAEEPVTVTLASGRVFAGSVDPDSDDRQLVLRTRIDGITLWRPIDWQRIVRVEYAGHSMSGDDFRYLAEQLSRGDTLPELFPHDAYDLSSDEEILPAPQQFAPDPSSTTAARQQLDVNQATAIPSNSEPTRPVSLHLDATGVGRWRAGVEQDGIVLRIMPLDEFGRAVAVDGTLSVTLIGTRPSAFRGEFVHSRGEPFPQLGQWRVQVTPADFRFGEARVRLPFQAQHPQFNLELGPLAVVNADLVVPGAGVLSASADFVRIRPYSPVRDWQQQLEGYRYFPNERTLRTQ